MAWCENEHCRKDGLRKADIEFCEVSRKVLCHGCYAHVHPGWLPPEEYVDLSGVVPMATSGIGPRVGMNIQMSATEGIKAVVTYGGMSLGIHIPENDYRRLFGG